MFEIVSICSGGGYRYCRTDPPHPKANSKGLYPLHRVIVENHLGRFLEPDEVVHHVDGDKQHDVLSNLLVMSNAKHTAHHHPEVPMVAVVCPCGTVFSLKPHTFRLRQRRNKDAVYCSRSCGGRFSRPDNQKVAGSSPAGATN